MFEHSNLGFLPIFKEFKSLLSSSNIPWTGRRINYMQEFAFRNWRSGVHTKCNKLCFEMFFPINVKNGICLPKRILRLCFEDHNFNKERTHLILSYFLFIKLDIIHSRISVIISIKTLLRTSTIFIVK